MGKLLKVIGLSILGVLFIAGTSFAGYLDDYTNITIRDAYGEKGFTSDGSVGPTGQGLEDQEVEPGALANQDWDLEGFFQSGSLLALVGGWDFVSGDPLYPTIKSGDIFLDTNGDDNFDYVLDMDLDPVLDDQGNPTNPNYLTYSVYSGDFETDKTTGGPSGLNGLDWRYSGGGIEVPGFQNIGMAYVEDQPNGYGLTGGLHNAVFVDLAFLDTGTDFTSYFTMACGNDIVNGSTAPIPEPATMLLLGTGLIGLAGIGRKKLMGKKLTK